MTTMRWSDHVQKGLASARPAASAVAVGALYASTDTGVIEQSDGTTWSTYASTGATTLDALTDVDTSTTAPTDGQALKWNATDSKWEPADEAAGGATSLDGLSDVDTTTTAPTTGDVLAFDGTEWAPAAPVSGGAASLDDLTDVDTATTAPTDGQALVWNATDSLWEPATVSSGGGGTVTSVTAGNGTVTIGGTATDPTVAATVGTTAGTVAAGDDSRMTNARTPTAHASTHASAGSDPITIAESQVTNLTTDLAAKVPTTRTVTAGTGLTGGGDLSANRTLTVAYGTTSTTAAVGNDSRLSDARTPTAHASSHASGGSDAVALDASQVTRTTNAQTGTTYTLVLGDASKFVTLSNASAITLTVPPNSSVAFPVGTELILAQLGAGQVTITPGAGVTLNSTPGLKISTQYGTAALKKTATDTWLVFGRLST